MAAGRAFPVARQTMTSAWSAAFSADTEEGRILLLLSSKVPAEVQSMLHAAYSAILCLVHRTYQDYTASTPSAGTGEAPDQAVGQHEMQAGLAEAEAPHKQSSPSMSMQMSLIWDTALRALAPGSSAWSGSYDVEASEELSDRRMASLPDSIDDSESSRSLAISIRPCPCSMM